MSATKTPARPLTSLERLQKIMGPGWEVKTDKRDDGWFGRATRKKNKLDAHVSGGKRHKATLRKLIDAIKAAPGVELAEDQVKGLDELTAYLRGED